MSADCCFTQLVNFPTRESNTLDVVFTNRPSLIDCCIDIPGISDHDAVLVSFHIRSAQQDILKHKQYIWNKANFTKLKCNLLEFSKHFVNCSSVEVPVEHLWDILQNKLIHLLNQFVPSKLVGTNYKKLWLKRAIKQLSRRKQKCYNRAKSTKAPLHWQYYKTVKKDMQRECRKAYNYYMNKTIFNLFKSGRKKNLFRYDKSLRTDNNGILILYKNGTTYSTNEAKANTLQ